MIILVLAARRSLLPGSFRRAPRPSPGLEERIMEDPAANATPQNVLFPNFVRPEIPRTLPILARLEDERIQLEEALRAFRVELAAQALGLNAA